MFREYVNEQNKHILTVNENEIRKTVRIINMLMLPKDYKTVLDKGIKFISDELFCVKDLKGYVFIAEENLTSDLKGLFKFYYGSLPLFMHDEFLDNRPDLLENYVEKESVSFQEAIISKLEDDLTMCLKKLIKAKQFLVKETYKGIVLYDPEKPAYLDKWKLKKIQI